LIFLDEDAMQSKNLLLSVKPAYANLLVDGIKTIELRRKFPVDLVPGTKCIIYASSPTQKVIGECKIKTVKRLKIDDLWKESSIEAMISWEDFKKYFVGSEYGYAIHVYAAHRYSKEILLNKLGKDLLAPQSYRYLPQAEQSAII